MAQTLTIVSQTVVLLGNGETSHIVLQVSVDGRQAFVLGTGNPKHFFDLWPEPHRGRGSARENFLGATLQEAVDLLELRLITDRAEWNGMQQENLHRWLAQPSTDQLVQTSRYDLIRG